MSRNLQDRARATAAALAVALSTAALALNGCGPSKPREPAAATGEASPATPAVPATTLADLQGAASIAPATWAFVEGVNVKPSSEAAKVKGQVTLVLTPTMAASAHRVGFARDFAAGGVYRVTVWVKANPGLAVTLEAGGKQMAEPGRPVDYAIDDFDLATNAVKPRPGNKDFKHPAVTDDDGWKKITADFSSGDGAVLPNVTISGAPNSQLTLGGVDIQARPS